MRHAVIFYAPLLAALMLLTGCVNLKANADVTNGKDSDATIKKTIAIGKFDKVEASQAIKIVFTQGKFNGKAQIATTPEAENFLVVEVEKGVLKAYYTSPESKKVIKKVKIKGPSIITIQAPSLCNIDLNSAASMIVKDKLQQSDPLKIELSSAAKLEADAFKLPLCEIETSSAASADINSISGDLYIESSSAGSVFVVNAVSSKIISDASSAGNISISEIQASYIKAEASSGGSIKLKGSTKTANLESTSGGTISSKHLNIKH